MTDARPVEVTKPALAALSGDGDRDCNGDAVGDGMGDNDGEPVG